MNTVLVFAATDTWGYYRELSYISSDMETGFVALNTLVTQGWQLHKVKMFDHSERPIILPAEAFDGQPFLTVFNELEREWKALLLTE